MQIGTEINETTEVNESQRALALQIALFVPGSNHNPRIDGTLACTLPGMDGGGSKFGDPGAH